jgi:hypothetical protein
MNAGLDYFSAGYMARFENKQIDKAEWVNLREIQPQSNNPLYFYWDNDENCQKIVYTGSEVYKWNPSEKQIADVDYFARVE